MWLLSSSPEGSQLFSANIHLQINEKKPKIYFRDYQLMNPLRNMFHWIMINIKVKNKGAETSSKKKSEQSKPLFPDSAVYKPCSFQTTYNLIYTIKFLPKPLPHLIENKEDLNLPAKNCIFSTDWDPQNPSDLRCCNMWFFLHLIQINMTGKTIEKPSNLSNLHRC